MDMKLELMPIPVTDVNRPKAFYTDEVGFNVDLNTDADSNHRVPDMMRVVQITPPGSACSISIGSFRRHPHGSRQWVYEGSPFLFVTDGVDRAIEEAKAVAGNKGVGVGGANVAQQAIKAGLVDEIGIDLVPVLLGEGVRFFDHLGLESIGLERTRVIEAPGVTHLRFRVV